MSSTASAQLGPPLVGVVLGQRLAIAAAAAAAHLLHAPLQLQVQRVVAVVH